MTFAPFVFPNTAKTYVDDSSVSITRDASKCILCGQCVRMCNEVQSVGAIHYAHRGSHMLISTAFERPIAETVCVGCGQCAAVCPVGAITIKQDTAKVWKAIADKNLVVTAQVAPAVRVATSARNSTCPREPMSWANSLPQCIAWVSTRYTTHPSVPTSPSLKKPQNLLNISAKNTGMPLFTSCCPGWIQFAEKKHPEIMPYISTCKSPMQMLSALIVEQQKDCEKKHFNIAVMPCTGKNSRLHAANSPMTASPMLMLLSQPQELIHTIRTAGIEFDTVVPEAIDAPFGMLSGAGVIFGATGGVTEAVLRRVSDDKSINAIRSIGNCGVRGTEGVKEFTVPFNGGELRIAVVSGLGNAESLSSSLQRSQL